MLYIYFVPLVCEKHKRIHKRLHKRHTQLSKLTKQLSYKNSTCLSWRKWYTDFRTAAAAPPSSPAPYPAASPLCPPLSLPPAAIQPLSRPPPRDPGTFSPSPPEKMPSKAESAASSREAELSVDARTSTPAKNSWSCRCCRRCCSAKLFVVHGRRFLHRRRKRGGGGGVKGVSPSVLKRQKEPENVKKGSRESTVVRINRFKFERHTLAICLLASQSKGWGCLMPHGCRITGGGARDAGGEMGGKKTIAPALSLRSVKKTPSKAQKEHKQNPRAQVVRGCAKQKYLQGGVIGRRPAG